MLYHSTQHSKLWFRSFWGNSGLYWEHCYCSWTSRISWANTDKTETGPLSREVGLTGLISCADYLLTCFSLFVSPLPADLDVADHLGIEFMGKINIFLLKHPAKFKVLNAHVVLCPPLIITEMPHYQMLFVVKTMFSPIFTESWLKMKTYLESNLMLRASTTPRKLALAPGFDCLH